MTDATALSIPGGTALEALFRSGDGIDPLIERIKKEVMSHAPDLTTRKGREAIASLAHNVSKSNVALDTAGKTLTENAKREIAVVDAARKRIRDQLDALRDEVRKPLTDWESAEEARVARCKSVIAGLINHGIMGDETAADIRAKAEQIKAIDIGDDFGEYGPQATGAREATLNALRAMYSTAKTREDQAEELAKLRAEKEAREEADRVKAEAEAEAARQKEAADRAERDRIAAAKEEEERVAKIEADKIAAAKAAAEQAEARAKAEAEEREAASAREKAETEARHQREMAEAKEREERAAQAERDRITAERKAEADARAKREADKEHRAKIASDIAEALATMKGKASPEQIAEALIEGRIPHCRVVM